jgi:hypothetical protein
MRKIHILLILLLLPLAVAATGNDRTDTVGFVHMPLYIVDGKIGVQPSDVPESSEIASVTILNDEEAIDLYGERAAYGVIVIRTKDFEKTHAQQSAKQHRGEPGKLGRWVRKFTGGNMLLGILICIIIVVAIMALPTIIPLLLTRNKKHKQGRKAIYSNYDQGTFDAEGVRFEAVKQPKNYFIPIICLAIISMFGIILYKTFISTPPIGILLVILIFFGGISVLFILAFVNSCKLLRSYLVIDEEGIRGYVANTERLNLKMDFRKIDISWEQIKRAQMDGYLITFFKKGTKIPDNMVDFAELADTDITEKEIENSIYQLDLSAFPINKVKDSINYFYARKNGIAKQPSLIKPDPLEKTNVLTIILVILAVLLLSYLAK